MDGLWASEAVAAAGFLTIFDEGKVLLEDEDEVAFLLAVELTLILILRSPAAANVVV